MGKVTIQLYTTKTPIHMIGYEAGICWGADISDYDKNYARGLNCIESCHGRTWEFPDVYATIDGYSARVVREWYTHIGGLPTRLQESTRYVDFSNGFDFVTPKSIESNIEANALWLGLMENITHTIKRLEEINIPKEDAGMCLPLSMKTKIVDKRNFRNIVDMSQQRLCSRAFWEYKNELMKDYLDALSNYSKEWNILISKTCKPKCETFGFCQEQKSCGRKPKKIDKYIVYENDN